MNRISLLLLTVILSACASVKSGLDDEQVPSANTSVVIGRSQFVHNGIVTFPTAQTASALISPLIMSHVRTFSGVDTITKNQFVAGQWAIKAQVKNDGYFAISLPPGKYYFSEYAFPGQVADLVGIRSYMSILGDGHIIKEPSLTTFEVLPGSVTYIGTMQHLVDDVAGSRRHRNWELRILDESETTKAWLRKKYPKWSNVDVSVRLAQTQLLK